MKFRLNMTTTMTLISALPLLFLLAFSSFFLYQTYTFEYLRSKALVANVKETEVLSKLSIDLARERGLSAVFTGSGGESAENLLVTQHVHSDKTIQEFFSYLEGKPLTPQMREIVEMLRGIPAVREHILSLKSDFHTFFFDYYSKINLLAMGEINRFAQSTETGSISKLSYTLAALYQEMEYAGQERGFVSKILTQQQPFTAEELQTWVEIIGKNSAFSTNLLPDGPTKEAIDKAHFSTQNRNIFSQVNRAKATLMLEAATGDYTIEPNLWFGMTTNQINIMDKTASMLRDALQAEIDTYTTSALLKLNISGAIWILSFLLLVMGLFLRRSIRKNVKELGGVFEKIKELTGGDTAIDLNTPEGTQEAYRAIDKSIESIAIEKHKAEEASAAKSIFLANMSHEIRTPLNGIIGFTELLKNSNLGSEEKEFIDVIEKSSENLLTIINNILDLSKIESSHVEIDESPFFPIEEFEGAAEVYGAKASEKNINFLFFIDPSLTCKLKGDVTKIKEVLINLLSNAIKFTPANGTINLQIKRLPQEGPKTALYFCVEDSGIGISQEKQASVFNAFSQADSTITRKYGGTGLGLTISSKFIETLGGNLEVESEEGKGSKFFFTLYFDEIVHDAKPNHKDEYSAYTCAILSKDSGANSSYVYDYLAYYGLSLKTYTTLSELKNLIHKSGVTLIVVDQSLLAPGELDEYKKIHLPILAIGKHSQKDILDKTKDTYITTAYRPINPTKILKWLALCQKLAPKKQAPVLSRAIMHPSGKFSAKVLVAEDNEINQKLIRRTLEDLGLTVTCVNNGLLALQERTNNHYDMIFMDIAMPIMDGVEATKKIIQYEQETGEGHIPIVAITANALKGDRERFMGEGLDEYVTKPIKREDIQSILNQFLSHKGVDEAPSHPTEQPFLVEADEHTTSLQEGLFLQETPPLEAEKLDISIPPKQESENILVFKKNPIETKIFTSVLRKITPHVFGVDSLHSFKETLRQESFGLIMIDYETQGIKMDLLLEHIQESQPTRPYIVLFASPSEIIPEEEKKLYSKIANTIVSKVDLETIVNEFFPKGAAQ